MLAQNVYIVDALRTPVGKAPKGVFCHTRPDDLLAHVIKAICDKYPKIDLAEIDDVIVGCAMPEAEQGMNVARISTLLAGLPDCVPAMTINRFCSSGLQSIALAADRIRCGQANMILAGGVESMSMVPLGGHNYMANPRYFNGEGNNIAISYNMGITAEIVAEKWQISRDQQQRFALESHRRASLAIKNGDFVDEIVPYTLNDPHPNLENKEISLKPLVVQHDEGPRADTSLEKMSTLKPVFANKGSITAATSSQTSDGAAMTLVVSENIVKRYQLDPIAKFHCFSVVGVAPEIMGIGPVKAIPTALKNSGLTLSDLSHIELNEAFAAQILAVMKELALDHTAVNPQGGALALGHPLGATGAIRTATLLHALKRKQQRFGIVSMCIGTGMGAAGVFENLCL